VEEQSYSSQGCYEAKEGVQGAVSPLFSSKACPHMTRRLPTWPYLLKLSPPPHSAMGQDTSLTTQVSGGHLSKSQQKVYECDDVNFYFMEW
jgi:hypothetical protein